MSKGLTVKQAARKAKVNRRTMQGWCSTGRVSAQKNEKGQWLIDKDFHIPTSRVSYRRLIPESSANVNKLGYVGKVPGSRDSSSWFTPKEYIDMSKDVLGSIDLDPFSSKEANRIVGAEKFFSEENSAFDNEWDVLTVFMNPPYGAKIINKAITRFLDQQYEFNFDAVVLVNNCTETVWFQNLLHCSAAVCFPRKRISFWNADGKSISGNTRGQAFFYFGNNCTKFKKVFSLIGEVLL